MDLDLLSLLTKKEQFVRFRPYLQEHILAKETNLIINTIESYFKHFNKSDVIDWAAFESYFFAIKAHQLTEELSTNFRTVFGKLKSHTPTIAADDVLRLYVTADYSNRITDASLKVRDGTATIDDIGKLVADHDRELGRAINASDLMIQVGAPGTPLRLPSAPGLEWRLEELNISCGPLRQGDFVIVSAYVETGKTTFAASEVSHMATQIKSGRPVVWVNNEEQSDKVALRVMQAALGRSVADIGKDEASAYIDYAKLLGPTVIHVSKTDSEMNRADKLNDLFREMNPALIVFDQLDKVSGFHEREQGEHIRLGRLYKWARELSHEYGPVIAISQSDASGEGEQYITMNQLRGSKVDKPGEADAIITIGKTNDKTTQNKRYLHICKNKLTGGVRTEAAERHGFWEIEIQPEVARYVGSR